MNYVEGIQDFFDSLTGIVQRLIEFLKVDELKDLLLYLYLCIPEDIKLVLLFLFLVVLLVGFVKVFRH